MYWPHMGGFGWGNWLVGALLVLLLLGALVALFYYLGRSGSTKRSDAGQGRNSSEAVEILKQRYARGEISKTEYEEMRRELAA